MPEQLGEVLGRRFPGLQVAGAYSPPFRALSPDEDDAVVEQINAARPDVDAMLTSDHWTERKAAVCLLRRWGKLSATQQAQVRRDEHVAVRQAAG